MSLPARVRHHAHTRPNQLFCTFLSDGTAHDVTYREFYVAACAYAREYRRRGVRNGDVVLIILRHGSHLFSSFLGAMLVGAVPSFMPFPSSKQRSDLYWTDHQALFERLRPRLIVSYEDNLEAAAAVLARFGIEAMLAGAEIVNGVDFEDEDFAGLAAHPDSVACLQHSSGTTGLKKGVMLTHRAMLDHVAAYAKACNFSGDDRIVSWLPVYHDMGFIACFMMSIVNGTHLVALDAFEWSSRPHILLDAIQTYRPTLCWLPNFAFSHLVRTTKRSARYDLSSMRAFINCSEPCKAATFDRFVERFTDSGVSHSHLAVCYAMAENVFAVTQTRLGERVLVLDVDAVALSDGMIRKPTASSQSQRMVSCGTLIDGVDLRLCDVNGNETEPMQIGEICLSGRSLFAGYYAQPELTKRRLQNGWYATGDLGFVHGGQLYVTGRADDMIVVNGRNYYAHEIELLVSEIPGIAPGRIAAIGINDAQSDATVVVILAEMAASISDVTSIVRAIRSELLERLGLSVQTVVPLTASSLIKTTSGKISRTKNKEIYLNGAFQSEPIVS